MLTNIRDVITCSQNAMSIDYRQQGLIHFRIYSVLLTLFISYH